MIWVRVGVVVLSTVENRPAKSERHEGGVLWEYYTLVRTDANRKIINLTQHTDYTILAKQSFN